MDTLLFIVCILIALISAAQSLFGLMSQSKKNEYEQKLNEIGFIHFIFEKILRKNWFKTLWFPGFPLLVLIYTVTDKISSSHSDAEKDKEISELRKKADGRFLTEQQIKIVTNTIREKNVPPQKVLIFVQSCFDCTKFSKGIEKSLKNSGWEVAVRSFMPFSNSSPPHGINLLVKEDNSSIEAFAEGMKNVGIFPITGNVGKSEESFDFTIFIYSDYSIN